MVRVVVLMLLLLLPESSAFPLLLRTPTITTRHPQRNPHHTTTTIGAPQSTTPETTATTLTTPMLMRTRIIARSSLPRNDADDGNNGEDKTAVASNPTTTTSNTVLLSRRRLFSTIPSRAAAIVAITTATASSSGVLLSSLPPPADARNLPVSNGADTSHVGTATAFVPILQLRQNLASLQDILEDEEQQQRKPNSNNRSDGTNDLQVSRIAKTKSVFCFPATQFPEMEEIPYREQDFKRIFDAYSDPVSYKQKFLDANAFLVYYTKGYDGPGRTPIEGTKDEIVNERQTLQFGTRNEAWVCWDEFVAEYDYYAASSSRKTGATTEERERSYVDMLQYLSQTIHAVDRYIQVSAPAHDPEDATTTTTTNQGEQKQEYH